MAGLDCRRFKFLFTVQLRLEYLRLRFQYSQLVDEVKHAEHLIARDLGRIPILAGIHQQYPAILVIPALHHVHDVVMQESLLLVDRHQIVQQSCILLLEVRDAFHQCQGTLRIEFAWSQESQKEIILGGEENRLVLWKEKRDQYINNDIDITIEMYY